MVARNSMQSKRSFPAISHRQHFSCARRPCFPHSNLVIDRLLLNPTRAAILDVLASMGAKPKFLQVQEQHGELIGTLGMEPAGLTGLRIDGALTASLIDELPVFAAIGPYTRYGIEIRDAKELRVKESDRIAVVCANLRAMGAEVEEFEDGLRVKGSQKLHGAEIDSHDDHRIAMAFAIAALRAEGETTIQGAECVAISYPEFFETLGENHRTIARTRCECAFWYYRDACFHVRCSRYSKDTEVQRLKILVTGGAGFIGSHLCERLLERGDEVHIVDDLSTGSVANFQHLKSNPAFHYHIDSITNHALMAELVDLCDTVFHLAAAVGVRLIVDSPVRTMETNIRGTEIVLELAEKKRKRVLITSTSEVYGKREQIPFREDDDLIMGPTNKGRWSYACSKAIDEFLAIAYWKEKKVPTVDCPTLQYRRSAPDGTLRHGDSKPRVPGTERRRHYRLRRRPAEPLLYPCERCGRGAILKIADASRSQRRGLQHRQPAGDHYPRSSEADQGTHRLGIEDRLRSLRSGV